ncbi:MAG: homocysteine S-methyltransferase family protein [bacterium]|jgi:S-methylmethionine-dependent homocysteine/selenocysteine methylase
MSAPAYEIEYNLTLGSSFDINRGDIRARLALGDVVILDGAMGTELERHRAISTSPLWSAEAVELREELVAAIHRDYIAAGAEIITTATFRSTKRTFEKIGRAGDYLQNTRRAVELAKEAVSNAGSPRQIFIAGSIAPLEDCFRPDLVPSKEECEREHGAQAELLADCGVDFILAETFNSVSESVAVAKAARATCLPYFVAVTCTTHGTLLSEESIELFVDSVAPYEPACLLINCTPARSLLLSLQRLAARFPGAVGAYGNVGMSASIHWEFTDEVTPAAYLNYAKTWLASGARVLGGCCGTNPEFIRLLSFHLEGAKPIRDSGV